MKSKVGFSIQTKILLLLLAFPIISLSVFLFISVRLFDSDKRAYVFSSIYSQAQGFEQRLRGWSETQIQLLKSTAYFFNFEDQALSESGQEFLSTSRQVKLWQVYRGDSDSWRLVLSDGPGDDGSAATLIGSLPPLSEGQVHVQAVPENPGRFLFATLGLRGSQKFLFLLVSENELLRADLQSARGATILYRSAQGLTWGPSDEFARSISQALQAQSTEQKIQDGSFEMPGLALVAVVQAVAKGDSIAVAVPESEVFRARDELVQTTLYAALGLIGLIIMSGVVLSRVLTSPILILTKAVRRLAAGEFGATTEVRSTDEIGVLSRTFDEMSIKLKELVSSQVHKARMEKELEMAQAVQEKLLPPATVQAGPYKFSSFYLSASECGGDLWQFFETDQSCHVVIADVTGHGAASSLMTAAICACIASLKEKDPTPVEALEELNRTIFQVFHGQMMATALWVRFDKRTGGGHLASAAHDNPMMIPANWNETKKTWRDLEALSLEPALRIGEKPVAKYQAQEFKMPAGSKFLIYTDGVFARLAGENEPISESRFLRMVAKAYQNEGPSFESLVRDLSSKPYIPEAEDDLTMVMIERS